MTCWIYRSRIYNRHKPYLYRHISCYMLYRVTILTLVVFLEAVCALAQADSNEIKNKLRSHISALAAPHMQGRGYVNNGLGLAAEYIETQFKKLNMEPLSSIKGYKQLYKFPVNTFPGRAEVSLNGTTLVAGKDFLIDAASASCKVKNKQVKYTDIGNVGSVAEWKKTIASFSNKYIYLLQNIDSFSKHTGVPAHSMSMLLPEGCYIIPVKAKQSWTVSAEAAEATVIYVYDSVLPANITTADITIETRLEEKFTAANIMASIPGNSNDSFIIFSAHYDHLGRMGSAVFPGASDNASGTAMMLYLAEYFSTHKPRHTMIFIAFSGEEIGLKGSEYFVSNPPFRLGKIKFLTNVDIMGDATNGVVVVNATEFPAQFSRLTALNNENKYLPEVRSRGKAANSDHYHFTEKGVPAFFIYSNGGKGYYHDIYDRAEEITLKNVAGLAHLLVNFIDGL